MTTLNTIIKNARRLAFTALLGSSFALVGCGGGGADGGMDDDFANDEDIVEDAGNNDVTLQQVTLLSTPELDGVVVGDNQQVNGRSDIQPVVGDGQFTPTVNQGAVRFQAYYSFNLSSLPQGARIKSATMSLYSRDAQGDPAGAMVLVRVDHVNYGNTFPTTLNAGITLDANTAQIGELETIGRKDVDVTTQLQADLDAGRSTSQYRLRGAVASNFDSVPDVIVLTDAEDTQGTGELPMLIIELE